MPVSQAPRKKQSERSSKAKKAAKKQNTLQPLNQIEHLSIFLLLPLLS
jgi:hypothetical protein